MGCNCTGQGHGTTTAMAPCEPGAGQAGLERTRYFPRQLVTPDDLTQDQIYTREKLRRHNRMLHGWGVVCGVGVRRGQNPCDVIVDAGYVLGPYGDEIVIPQPIKLDLCKMGANERVGCCGDEADPWCSDARQRCPEGVVYLAVRYAECDSRPVRTPGGCGCGCESEGCEYSRVRDSYAFKLLTELPSTYPTPFRAPASSSLSPCNRERTVRPCPPCPSEPWVIIADIRIGADCRIGSIDNFAHRRHVMSFAELFLACAGTPSVGSGLQSGAMLESPIMTARLMANMTGTNDLVDVTAAGFEAAPRATVAMRRADGTSVAVPAFFNVEPGDTIGDLLEREGERQFYDPASDQAYTLRELYAAAGVPSDLSLSGTTSALAPLEGRVLDIETVRAGRADLESVIDPEGIRRLERELGGSPARAGELPATTLLGVAPESAVGKHLGIMTIAEVAGMERETFVARLAESVPQRQRRTVERQAEEIWNNARRVKPS